MRSERDGVELFHLIFLRQLATGGDRTHLILKGGCNLRFFFRSLRYSEDIDLDVAVIARGTLKNRVDRLLESPALALPLKAQQIVIDEVSAPKQTDTTQRWKLGLRLGGRSVPMRTKVEFSRRETDAARGDAVVETIDVELARRAGIPPPLVSHYRAGAAVAQKIAALLGRPQTQARDVFDLQLLLAHLKEPLRLDTELRRRAGEAAERALSLSYEDYLAQVVAFLVPEQAEALRDRASWDAMQLEVVEFLQGLGR
jgi:predicted nucleotidyltransferase component of viral defense system